MEYRRKIDIEINGERHDGEMILSSDYQPRPIMPKIIIDDADHKLILHLWRIFESMKYTDDGRPIASSYKNDYKVYYKNQFIGTFIGCFPNYIDADFQYVEFITDWFQRETTKHIADIFERESSEYA